MIHQSKQCKRCKQKRRRSSVLDIRYALVTDRPSVALEDTAILSALECGLYAGTKDGYDISAFRKFWRRFAPMLDRWFQENSGCVMK